MSLCRLCFYPEIENKNEFIYHYNHHIFSGNMQIAKTSLHTRVIHDNSICRS